MTETLAFMAGGNALALLVAAFFLERARTTHRSPAIVVAQAHRKHMARAHSCESITITVLILVSMSSTLLFVQLRQAGPESGMALAAVVAPIPALPALPDSPFAALESPRTEAAVPAARAQFVVRVPGKGPLLLRAAPAGAVIGGLPQGSVVSPTQVQAREQAGRTWVEVVADGGTAGWVAQDFLHRSF